MLATGEPVFTPSTGGAWDLVGAVLFFGIAMLIVFGYLVHTGGRHPS